MSRELKFRIAGDDSTAAAALARTERGLNTVEQTARRVNTVTVSGFRSVDDSAGAAANKVTTFGSRMQSAGSVVTGVVSGMAGGLVVGAITGLVDKLGGMATGFIQSASHIQDWSDRMHVSTDAVQGWMQAVERSGGSFPALANSAQFLFKALAGDDKSVGRALADLGLDLAELKKQSPETIFETVTAAIGNMKDPLEQARVGAMLMGRGFATNLAAMTEGLGKVREEAVKTGAVMSKDAVAAGDKLGDTFEKLKDVGGNLLSVVFKPILPLLTSLLEIVVAVLAPLGDLLNLILTPIAAVLTKVGEGITALIGFFKDLFSPVDGASSKLGEFWSWLHDKLGPILDPILTLLSDLAKMFIQIAETVYAVHVKVIQYITKLVLDVTMWLVDKLQPIFRPFIAAFEMIATVFNTVKDTVLGIVQAMYEGIKTWLLDKFTAVVDGIRDKINAVTGFFKSMYDKVVGGSYVPDMITEVGQWFDKLPEVMGNPALTAAQKVVGIFGGLANAIGGAAGSMIGSIGGVFQSLSGLSSALSGGGGILSTLLGVAGPIGGLIGAGAGIVSGLKNLWGDSATDMIQDWQKQFGGGNALHALLLNSSNPDLGEQLWVEMTQRVGKKNTAHASQVIGAVEAFLRQYGQGKPPGPVFTPAEFDEPGRNVHGDPDWMLDQPVRGVKKAGWMWGRPGDIAGMPTLGGRLGGGTVINVHFAQPVFLGNRQSARAVAEMIAPELPFAVQRYGVG